jgi:hypothetical protein
LAEPPLAGFLMGTSSPGESRVDITQSYAQFVLIGLTNILTRSQQDLPMGPTKEVVIKVDLDQEEGITPREGRENRFRVVIRKTGVVDLSAIRGYLDGTIEFNNAVLQGISK